MRHSSGMNGLQVLYQYGGGSAWKTAQAVERFAARLAKIPIYTVHKVNFDEHEMY